MFILSRFQMPSYLSSIYERRFVRLIEQHVPSIDRSLNREDLRQVAILMHHVTVLELERSLWDSYLKCATSMVQRNGKYPRFWPAAVIAMFRELAQMTTLGDVDQIRASDDDYLRIVQRQLCDLEKEGRALQCQLNHRKKRIYDYERIWEEPLRAFVVEQTESFRQQFQCKVQLVEFDNRAHQLECEFREESPNTAQVRSLFSIG